MCLPGAFGLPADADTDAQKGARVASLPRALESHQSRQELPADSRLPRRETIPNFLDERADAENRQVLAAPESLPLQRRIEDQLPHVQDVPGRDLVARVNIFASLNEDGSLNMHVSKKLNMRQAEEDATIDPKRREALAQALLSTMEFSFRLRFADMMKDKRIYFATFKQVKENGIGGYIVVEWKVSYLDPTSVDSRLPLDSPSKAVMLTYFQTREHVEEIVMADYIEQVWRHFTEMHSQADRVHFDTVTQAHVGFYLMTDPRVHESWELRHDPTLYERIFSDLPDV